MAIFPNINPTTTSGSDLAALLNSFRDSVIAGFIGTARPAGLLKGGYWIDNSLEISDGIFKYYLFDGTSDVFQYSINKVTGRIVLPTVEAGMSIKQVSADAVGPIMELFKARIASSGKVLSGDQLGKYTFASTDDTGAKITDAASIEAVALEDHTTLLQGTQLQFYTRQSGTNTKFKQLEIGDFLQIYTSILPYYVGSDANSNAMSFRKARGTTGAETAVLADDGLAFIGARGHDGTSYNSGSKVSILMAANQNHTPTANGTYMLFRTTADGTTTIKTRLSVNADGALGFHGSTSGILKIKPAATTTSHTLVMPGTQGAASTVLTNDGSGNLSWASAAASGADTSLSNLGSTAINADLIFTATPQTTYDSPSSVTHIIATSATSVPGDLVSSHNLKIATGTSSTGSTGSLLFKTPTATNQGWGFGTVKSGDITIDVGLLNGQVAKGKLYIKQNANGGGTTGTVGHVLTQLASTGECEWAAPSGGGSALTVQDEGTNLSTAVTKINFAGAGVTATQPVANEILVTIPNATSWTTSIRTVSDNNLVTTAFNEYLADTSSAFTLKLPASPAIGDRVRFMDKKGTWTTNNLTIDRNTKNIKGAAANFSCNVNYGAVEFVYSDATDGWLIINNNA